MFCNCLSYWSCFQVKWEAGTKRGKVYVPKEPEAPVSIFLIITITIINMVIITIIITIINMVIITIIILFQVKKEYDSDDEEEQKKTEVVEDPGTLNDEYRLISLRFVGQPLK